MCVGHVFNGRAFEKHGGESSITDLSKENTDIEWGIKFGNPSSKLQLVPVNLEVWNEYKSHWGVVFRKTINALSVDSF